MSKRMELPDFIARCRIKHGDRYDYSLVSFTSMHDKVRLVCPDHGEFEQKALKHLYAGQGCPICGGLRKGIQTKQGRLNNSNAKLDNARERFFRQAPIIHDDWYDYSLVSFTSMQDKVRLICPDHGEFKQKALKHLYTGQGCPDCGDLRKGNHTKQGRLNNSNAKIDNARERFFRQAPIMHGEWYDYSKVNYRKAREDVTIICPKHGEFRQKPWRHLQGRGCGSCGHKSAGELEVLKYVQQFDHEIIHRDRTLLKPKELDIYIPSAGVAVEYCGLYWHSTLKCDRAFARRRHIDKHRLCADAGVRLITIFEDEWLNRPDQVKAILSRILSKEKGCYARKCEVEAVEAPGDFYDLNHIQGAAPSRGVSYGLRYDDELVACMTFATGVSQRGGDGWELLRYATSRRVVGGASRLMKAFVRDYAPENIVSFSDNRWFGGAMYRELGFEMVDESKPDYSVVMPGQKRVHKSLFQRRSLPARIKELGSDIRFDPKTDKRTESQITHLIGCGQIFDCGKKKWNLQHLPADENMSKGNTTPEGGLT